MGIHAHENIPQDITPKGAAQKLKEGNFRFVNNLKLNRDLLEQVNDTKDSQWPFAAILSCMDSRTSAELIFDQGLGDIFSIRIAGNIISPGILGSLEYATAIAGSKLILVLGHTNCGAIKGACDDVRLGNLTSLLQQIKPAVNEVEGISGKGGSGNPDFVNAVIKVNIQNSCRQIVHQSPVIRKLIEEAKVGIMPAMYDVATGTVIFYDDDAIMQLPAEQTGHKVVTG